MGKKCEDSPNGQHHFVTDLEYDETGQSVSCEYCGELYDVPHNTGKLKGDRMVCGYEFPRQHKFNSRAQMVLRRVHNYHVCRIQTDDGLEDREMIQQLEAVSGVYFDVVRVNYPHVWVVVSHDAPEVHHPVPKERVGK